MRLISASQIDQWRSVRAPDCARWARSPLLIASQVSRPQISQTIGAALRAWDHMINADSARVRVG